MFPIVWDGKEFSVLHFSVTKCFFMQLLLSCNYHSPNIFTWNFKTWNFLAWNFFHWKFCHLKLFVTKLCLSLNFLHWIFCPSNFLSRNFLALNLFSRNFNSQDILFTVTEIGIDYRYIPRPFATVLKIFRANFILKCVSRQITHYAHKLSSIFIGLYRLE